MYSRRGVYCVQCMMCGRTAGQIRDGAFHRGPGAPNLAIHHGRRWCGYCGGNIYLEPDDARFLSGGAQAPVAEHRRAS